MERTNPLNALQEATHYSFTKFCIYCFSLWYEFCVHCALRVEKIISMVLMWDLWNFSFLGRGMSHQSIQNSVALFRGHTQNTRSISHNNFVKKILSASANAIMSWQDVTRFSLCSGVKECGTKRAHNFLSQILFQIPKNYCLGDDQRFCYHSWCDSMVIFEQISNSSNVYLSSSRF